MFGSRGFGGHFQGALSLLILLIFAGCGGGAVEGQPVSLPVPFSGSLTPDARVVVSNGDPINASTALGFRLNALQVNGKVSWNIFNSDGSHAGTVVYGSSTPQNSSQDGKVTSFFVPVTLIFDDGGMAASNQVKCYDFDYPINAPNDPTILQTKGVCSGYVTQAIGSMANALGKTMDHRYVYQFKLVNGQRVFDKISWGPWIVQR